MDDGRGGRLARGDVVVDAERLGTARRLSRAGAAVLLVREGPEIIQLRIGGVLAHVLQDL